jgi:transcriptional regulator with XRE-family HTH domain
MRRAGANRAISVRGNTCSVMAKRIRANGRRTPTQAAADDRAGNVATYLDRSLLEGRRQKGATQAEMSKGAGIAPSTWSKLETGDGADVSIVVWARAARVIGGDLHAYIDGTTATDQPRDAVHLRAQELVVRTATNGGWIARPEAAIDLDPGRSRAVDVVLARGADVALVEIYDWLPDVGEAFRSWDRRQATVEARAIALAPPGADATEIRVSGIWVLRATRVNRRLVSDYRALFRARFPGSAAAWLTALERPDRRMPAEPALLWITIRGDRLIPARLG